MRKIDREAASAFLAGRPYSNSNTTVTVEAAATEFKYPGITIVRMYLHGNLIAWRTVGTDRITMTLAGWPTVTTRARLNALLDMTQNVRIFQHKHVQYWGGSELGDTDTIRVAYRPDLYV